MLRVSLYARVSTEEQAEEGRSIEAQSRVMRELCERKGWTVVQEYIDDGVSGRTLKRPRFQQLLADASKHHFDVLMVHKLDRLSRSLTDTLLVLSDLSKQDVSFVSATEDFDFTTPIGKVLLALLAAFAQYYIDNLREETKKGKKERALKGLYNGSLPFGYLRVSKAEGGVPILHPTNVEGYRMAICAGAKGHTVREIVNLLNAAGYRTTGNWGARPFSQDTVLPMLKNRFYLGEISYKGTWMKGKHSAAIDVETWERCQEQIHRRLNKHETTKTTDRIYLLRKLLYCATCGRPLRGQNRRGERRYRDPSKSYGENCSEPQTVSAEALEKQMGDYLMQIRLPDEWLPEAMQWIGEDGELAQRGKQLREELQAKLERIKRLYLLGDIVERDYLAERTQIQNALLTIRPTKMPDLELVAQALLNFEHLWTQSEDAERMRLLRQVLEKAYVHQGAIVAIEPHPDAYPLLMIASRSRASSDEMKPQTKSFPVAPVEPSEAKAVDFIQKSTAFALFFDILILGWTLHSTTIDPVRRFDGSILPTSFAVSIETRDLASRA